MKKTRVLSLALAAALVVTSIVAAPDASAAKKKVSLSKKKQTLYVGKSVTIKVKNGNKKAKVTWSVSNKKVLKLSKKVTKGNKASVKVKGAKKGTAKLTASYKLGKAKAKKYTCKFTVKKATNPTAAPTNPVVPVVPTATPTAAPTNPAGGNPTAAPTDKPEPTDEPGQPTAKPTDEPGQPTAKPTDEPGQPTAKPTATPGGPTATPTNGPTEKPTEGPTFGENQLNHLKATDSSGKAGVNNADGSVTFSNAELVLIPLDKKYAVGDKVVIKINGTAEGTTPRTWISDGAWTRCSSIANPYTMGEEAVVTIENANGKHVQIKGTGANFTSLTITSVYVYPYTEPEVTPTPTPTDVPTSTPGPVEITGIEKDGNIEYVVPATAKSLKVEVKRDNETFIKNVDIDAVAQLVDEYIVKNSTIYDVVSKIAKLGVGDGYEKELEDVLVKVEKQTADKAIITVTYDDRTETATADFVKTQSGYDVTVNGRGKTVVVKVTEADKNAAVIVKDSNTYSVKVTEKTATSVKAVITTNSGRVINAEFAKTDKGYTATATSGDYVATFVKDETGTKVVVPKKVVEKVDEELAKRSISYKVYYVE